jgi:hypothetical protein
VARCGLGSLVPKPVTQDEFLLEWTPRFGRRGLSMSSGLGLSTTGHSKCRAPDKEGGDGAIVGRSDGAIIAKV